jgi:hypothetical protein
MEDASMGNLSRIENALAELNSKISEGSEIWDVIDTIAKKHRITEATLLNAYDDDQLRS